jgi:hypothetical protein
MSAEIMEVYLSERSQELGIDPIDMTAYGINYKFDELLAKLESDVAELQDTYNDLIDVIRFVTSSPERMTKREILSKTAMTSDNITMRADNMSIYRLSFEGHMEHFHKILPAIDMNKIKFITGEQMITLPDLNGRIVFTKLPNWAKTYLGNHLAEQQRLDMGEDVDSISPERKIAECVKKLESSLDIGLLNQLLMLHYHADLVKIPSKFNREEVDAILGKVGLYMIFLNALDGSPIDSINTYDIYYGFSVASYFCDLYLLSDKKMDKDYIYFIRQLSGSLAHSENSLSKLTGKSVKSRSAKLRAILDRNKSIF